MAVDTIDGYTYELLGQEISIGSMWGSRSWPNGVSIVTGPAATADFPQAIAFLDVGTPFNIWKWLVETFIPAFSEQGMTLSDVMSQTTQFMFDSDGVLLGVNRSDWNTPYGIPYHNNYASDYIFTICIYSAGGGKYYALAQNSRTLDFHWDSLVSYQQSNLGYYGATLPTLTNDDQVAGSFCLFKPQKAYVPDITDIGSYAYREASQGGGLFDPLPDNAIYGLMNGIVNHYWEADTANSLAGTMNTANGILAGSVQTFSYNAHDWNPNLESVTQDWYGPYLGSIGILGDITYDYSAFYTYGNLNYWLSSWSTTDSLPPLTVLSHWEDDTTGDNPVGGNGPGNFVGNPQDPGNWVIPGIGPSDSGFTHLYTPNTAQLRSLSQKLWTDDFFDNIIKMFQDPMESIIALNILPINLDDYRGSAEIVTIGNITLDDVLMYPLSQDYIPFDFGTKSLDEIYQTALDYSPYTKYSVYLPFIGYVDLDPSDVQRPNGKAGAIHLKYMVNLFTGDCVACLFCVGTWGHETLIGTYTGNCAFQIPFSGANYSNVYKNVISGVASTALAMTSGGFGAVAGAAGMVNSALATAAGGVQVQRSGALSGGASVMNYLRPHILRCSPNKSIAPDYGKIMGYASNKNMKFKKLKGFTMIEDLNLDGFTGTNAEADELKSLLKSGVIF